MHPLSPFFCIIIFFIAFATAFLLKKIYNIKAATGRYESIDGLRGFLAIGVFIHHAAIWHQYLQSGDWAVPKSNLYTLLGQASVSLFFMITSFLFVNKILEAKNGEFNFKQFFISRLYRLTPLYLFTVFLLVVIVMCITNWHLNVSPLKFLNSIVAWLLFSIFGDPSINNSSFATLANAGVVWSLPYEWLFYFSIPVIYMIIWRRKIPIFFFILSVGFLTFFFIKNGFIKYHLICFFAGAVAPILIKYFPIYKKLNKYFASVIILVSLFFIGKFDSSHKLVCIILLSLIFTLVALGNDIFGLLKNKSLQLLGEICYSTYLLHGIVLFSLFHFVLKEENVKQYSSLQYCLVVFLITPLVVIISYVSFKCIEDPFMKKAKMRFNKEKEVASSIKTESSIYKTNILL
jgi:peptidoglycan/LPS O-acetylase OafA/YrhL